MMKKTHSDSFSPTINSHRLSGSSIAHSNSNQSTNHNNNNNNNNINFFYNNNRLTDDNIKSNINTGNNNNNNQQLPVFIKSNKAVVSDAIATNNTQLLLANLYFYFIENKNFKSAISLLKQSDVPISISDSKNIKINSSPISNISSANNNKVQIYKINHPDGVIELYENEYLKYESSIPSRGTFLLQWWESLWSLYNFANMQPLELVTSIRPFIDVIKPILPETNLPAISPLHNLNTPSSQAFFSQQQQQVNNPNLYPPADALRKKKQSPINSQQNVPFGFDNNNNNNNNNDNINVNNFNHSSQRVPPKNNNASLMSSISSSSASPSSPFSHLENSLNFNNNTIKPKPFYDENDVDYMKNFQEYAAGNNQFHKGNIPPSKSHFPTANNNQPHTSASPGAFFSPNNIHPSQTNNHAFNNNNSDVDHSSNNSNSVLSSRPGGFNNNNSKTKNRKFYPQDGVFIPVANNSNTPLNNNNNSNGNKNTSNSKKIKKPPPLNLKVNTSPNMAMHQLQQEIQQSGKPPPFNNNDMPLQNPQPPVMSNQSPHVNMKQHQYPVGNFANMQQMFNQQNNSIENSNNNNKGVFPPNGFIDNTNLSQISPFPPQHTINQHLSQNKKMMVPNQPSSVTQQSPTMHMVPNPASVYNGNNVPLTKQQQQQLMMQMKNGGFPPPHPHLHSIPQQQQQPPPPQQQASAQMNAPQQFNNKNMPAGIMTNMSPSIPPFMNGGSNPPSATINNQNFKIAQYPPIPEGVRFNMKDIPNMPNGQYMPGNNSSNNCSVKTTSNSSVDWGWVLIMMVSKIIL